MSKKTLNPNSVQTFKAFFNFSGDELANLSADDRKKRPRTAFTAAQIKALESEFEKNKYLSVSKRMQLSKQLKLTETQVKKMKSQSMAFPNLSSLDKNLVSKSPHEMETQIHKRSGAAGSAILLELRNLCSSANVCRRSTLAVQSKRSSGSAPLQLPACNLPNAASVSAVHRSQHHGSAAWRSRRSAIASSASFCGAAKTAISVVSFNATAPGEELKYE